MHANRFLVQGLVQGVGYRYFVYRIATRLSLRGFVRNLDDGRVEVVAAGGDEALREMEGLLRQGPAHARVQRVDVATADEASLPTDFRIEV